MLHDKLMGLVTKFSPTLNDAQNMEEVTIGGEITRVFDVARIMMKESDRAKIVEGKDDFTTYYSDGADVQEDDQDEEHDKFWVYVSLDDGLGELNTILMDKVYNANKDKIFLGNVVLIKGTVYKIDSETKPKNGGRMAFRPPPWDIRIFAEEVMTLPQANKAKEKEE